MQYDLKKLERMTLDELKEAAKSLGIRVGHTKNPQMLMYNILDAQADNRAREVQAKEDQRNENGEAKKDKRERRRTRQQACRKFAVIAIICGTTFCCDCQTSGNRKPEQTHFSEVGTFTTQQVFHVGFTFGSLTSKGVNILYVTHIQKVKLIINIISN